MNDIWLLGRILAGCFWFCVLIWNATYTANLASFLVLTNSELPVTSLSDAITKDYSIAILRDSAIAHVIEISANPMHEKLWRRTQEKNNFVNTHAEGDVRTRNGQKVAFIAEEPLLKYFKGRKKCNLVMGKSCNHAIMQSCNHAIM